MQHHCSTFMCIFNGPHIYKYVNRNYTVRFALDANFSDLKRITMATLWNIMQQFISLFDDVKTLGNSWHLRFSDLKWMRISPEWLYITSNDALWADDETTDN